MNEQTKKMWEEECAQVAAYYAKLYKERLRDMSNRHPLADLLIYAADNKDALFHAWHNDAETKGGIDAVLAYPTLHWEVIKEPKTITKYQWAYQLPDIEQWQITGYVTKHDLEYFYANGIGFTNLEFTAKEFTE